MYGYILFGPNSIKSKNLTFLPTFTKDPPKDSPFSILRREKRHVLFFAKARIQDDKYFSHILRRSWGVRRTQRKIPTPKNWAEQKPSEFRFFPYFQKDPTKIAKTSGTPPQKKNAPPPDLLGHQFPGGEGFFKCESGWFIIPQLHSH